VALRDNPGSSLQYRIIDCISERESRMNSAYFDGLLLVAVKIDEGRNWGN
jgi:hypothetical protein